MNNFKSHGALVVAAMCLVLAGTNSCKKSSTVLEAGKPSQTKVEPRQGDGPPTVVFDLKPTNGLNTPFQRYDCTYEAREKKAIFSLELRQKNTASALVEGEFIAVKGSDNSALLEDLKTALDAKQIPTKSTRVEELPFDALFFGDKMSRSPQGTLSDTPPGDWMMIKIFLPKGGNDEGELFLNLNLSIGKGEFSMKDPDYGDYLLKEFAKVL